MAIGTSPVILAYRTRLTWPRMARNSESEAAGVRRRWYFTQGVRIQFDDIREKPGIGSAKES